MKNLKTRTKNLVLTQKGKLNKQISNSIGHCRFDNSQRKIYTGYYSGSGRFTSRHSAIGTIQSILNAQGYKFTTGNDSDRNGASGEFIKMSQVAFDFIIQIEAMD